MAEWSIVEEFLRHAFRGIPRKNGGEGASHSIRMGRALASAGHDDITVFGAYGHDVPEDTFDGDRDAAIGHLQGLAARVFSDRIDAALAVELAVEACYTVEEYALEASIGGKAGKLARKQAATARWLASDNPRLAIVKICDVDDNEADSHDVGDGFREAYLAWAGPFRAALRDKVAARSGQMPRLLW